jgi:hypothetical protein
MKYAQRPKRGSSWALSWGASVLIASFILSPGRHPVLFFVVVGRDFVSSRDRACLYLQTLLGPCQ